MRTPWILVAVDFSEPAAAAYRAGLELAAHAGAELRLLHITEQRDEQHEARMRDWLAQQQVEPGEVITLPGTPWVQIVRYCDETRPLLLVVGSHGAKGYQTLTPGTTTSQLLVRSPVPLLIVPRMAGRSTPPGMPGPAHADGARGPRLPTSSSTSVGSDDALH